MLRAPGAQRVREPGRAGRARPAARRTDYYGTAISYGELGDTAEALAGWLQSRCAVRKGDRVLLCLHNSLQFARIVPLLDEGVLQEAIVARYADYLRSPTNLPVPLFAASSETHGHLIAWKDAVEAGCSPGPHTATLQDLAVLP